MSGSVREASLEKTRATFYGILSRLYYEELTPEFLKELDGIGFLDLLFEGEKDSDKLPKGREGYEKLSSEYARLFVGPGEHDSPYASIYRSDDRYSGQLWGETTGEIKRIIEHYGLRLDKPGCIPDHLSILFEFMEKAARAKASAIESHDEESRGAADRIQQKFFFDYIDPWINTFLSRIKEANPEPFYSRVAEFTGRFIEEERKFLAKEEF